MLPRNTNEEKQTRDYIMKILRRTKLEQSIPSCIPMDTGYEKLRPASAKKNSKQYSRLIGALLYVSVNTRPDIAAPVALLAQHIEQKKTNRLERGTENLYMLERLNRLQAETQLQE